MGERIPYRLKPIVELLRDIARKNDTALELAMTELTNAIAQRGTASESEVQSILIRLTEILRKNTDAKLILDVLNDTTLDAALREAERIDNKYRQAEKIKQRRLNS